MSSSLEEISQRALALLPEQRLALAQYLLDSVDTEPQSEIDAAWDAEVVRRIQRLDAGESVTIPADEVFARLRTL